MIAEPGRLVAMAIHEDKGITIAIVAALLTLFIQLNLPADPPLPRASAAGLLSIGELADASHAAKARTAALVAIYGAAFQRLIHVLVCITVAMALLIFWLLRDRPADPGASGRSDLGGFDAAGARVPCSSGPGPSNAE